MPRLHLDDTPDFTFFQGTPFILSKPQLTHTTMPAPYTDVPVCHTRPHATPGPMFAWPLNFTDLSPPHHCMIHQAPKFAWLLNLTDVGEAAARPGFMATVLAPSDDAVWYMLKQKGEKEQGTDGRLDGGG